jgi:hypothetical protein
MCDFPGCQGGEPDTDGNPTPYMTSPDLTRRDEVTAELKEHMNMAHELPLRHTDFRTKQLVAETEKLQAEN